MHRRLLALVAVTALAVAASGARADGDCDWPMYGREPGRSFAQTAACTDLTPLNAATLIPKWHVATNHPVTASPSVVDGTVYVGSNEGTFYALDAETGETRWTFSVTDPNSTGFGSITSSAAIVGAGDKQVAIFGGGATVYVLDTDPAATQRVLTSICTDPRAPGPERCNGSTADIEILSSPAVVSTGGEQLVLIGHDVHNREEIGRTGMLAFRLESDTWALAPLWKFDPETLLTYTTDASQDGEDGFVVTSDPLTHDHGSGEGCGGVWSSPAVDVAGDRVFFGTASCSDDAPDSGESMWGIRLSDGGFVWQYNPRIDPEHPESKRFDDDFGASPNILPNGLVGEGSKDGWYYARDRATGAKTWAIHAGQAGHVNEDFAIGGMIGTAAVGEIFDEPAVFATTAIGTPVGGSDPNSPEPDFTLLEDPGRLFSIAAFSALDGRLLWRSPLSRQSYGAPTYARGVLLVPSTVDFGINVFDANTGVLLRRVHVEGAPSSAPAIVGDSVYMGSGTTVDPFPFENLSGIWGFRLAVA